MTPEDATSMPAEPSAPCEWAEVDIGVVVVATGDRMRIHHPLPWDADDPFRKAMEGAGQVATTGTLLRGACFAAALGRALPASAALSLPRLVYRLAGAWQTTRVTPPTLRLLAGRFEADGRLELRSFCLSKSTEEEGHDLLALRDLRALGLPAERVVAILRPAGSVALASHHERIARSDRPLRCFGYAFCLEWLATLRGSAALEAVRRVVPAGVDAGRSLRVHSGLGSDTGHVDELVALVSRLSAAERVEVAIGAFETARIMVEHAPIEPSDESIEEALRRGEILLSVAPPSSPSS